MGVIVCSVIFFISYIISNWVWIEALYDKFKSRRILLEVIVAIVSLIPAENDNNKIYKWISILYS